MRLRHLRTGRERRLLPPSPAAAAASCFATDGSGHVAVAEQGPDPRVWVYRLAAPAASTSTTADDDDATSAAAAAEPQLLAELAVSADLGVAALALSADGELLAVATAPPRAALSVWRWRRRELLASAPLLEGEATGAGDLAAAVRCLSFHPAETSLLLATAGAGGSDDSIGSSDGGGGGGGGTSGAWLWQLQRLPDGHHLEPRPLALPGSGGSGSGGSGSARATCHAWAPEGAYLGCAGGGVWLADPETGACAAAVVKPRPLAAAEPVTSVAVNAEVVAVCYGGGSSGGTADSRRPPLRLFERRTGTDGRVELRPAGDVPSTAGAAAVCLGGAQHRSALVATGDGALLLAELPAAHSGGGGRLAGEVLDLVPPAHSCATAFANDCVADAGATDAAAAAADDHQTLPSAEGASAAAGEAAAAAAAERARIASGLDDVRRELAALLAEDAAAPAAQRLPPEALVLDGARLAALRAAADAEAGALRAALSEAAARDEIVAARIKAEFWDSLAVKPAAVGGVQAADALVWNFPLAAEADEGKQEGQAAAAGDGAGRGLSYAVVAAQRVAELGLAGSSSSGGNHGSSGGGATHAAEAAASPWPPAERLLYGDLEVTTPARKRAQALLLRRAAREARAAFNAELEAAARRKRAEADRAADAAARLGDLGRELARLAPGAFEGGGAAAAAADGADSAAAQSVAVRWAPEEDLGAMLFGPQGAADEEEGGDGSTATSGAAAAGGARGARASAGAGHGQPPPSSSGGGALERGLLDMMGGSLTRAPDAAAAELAAARPAWMDGDPAGFSEQQRREFEEHMTKQRAASDERARRRVAVEQERRALRAAAAEAAAKFDEALAALAARRLGVVARAAAFEGRAARLEADADAADAAGEAAEAAALGRARAAREATAAAERNLAEARTLAAALQERAAAAQAEEKAADRAFKRDFAHSTPEAPAAPAKLAALYRQRVAAAAAADEAGAAAAAAAAGTPEPPEAGSAALVWATQAGEQQQPSPSLFDGPQLMVAELPDSARPDGVDAATWAAFVKTRAARARLEIKARDDAAASARAARLVAALEARRARHAAAAEAAEADAAALRAARAAACLDVECAFSLRAGQVEAEPRGVGATDARAVLVRRGAVEALNGAVRAKGRGKLALLAKMRDFSRGNREIEWENDR